MTPGRELEDIGGQHVHMPELPIYSRDRVLNAVPEIVRNLKGKVVLVDFWDYTCVNCIRTFPYLKEWHARYKDMGLVILGVHSPEFSFEKQPGNLESAVKRFGLEYPIIADNDFEIWQLFSNKYWPAKYLLDKDGILRTYHFGEGEYEEFESFIQKLLLGRDPLLKLPLPMAPLRDTDKPGAVCYRVTPETYIGFLRGHVGNEGGLAQHQVKRYVLPEKINDDVLYLEGMWRSEPEFAQLVQGRGSIVISYQAADVNLVIHPEEGKPFKVYVEQDGIPLRKEDYGDDVRKENGKAVIDVRAPRMYNIVKNKEFGRHQLEIISDSPSFRAYVFTFVTACRTL
ncbi:MAG: redoxin domain-containing protein [Actinomycetota bacterium]